MENIEEFFYKKVQQEIEEPEDKSLRELFEEDGFIYKEFFKPSTFQVASYDKDLGLVVAREVEYRFVYFVEHLPHNILNKTKVRINLDAVNNIKDEIRYSLQKHRDDAIIKSSNFELFIDPCYYNMWCVRHKGDINFSNTEHFIKKEDAIRYIKERGNK